MSMIQRAGCALTILMLMGPAAARAAAPTGVIATPPAARAFHIGAWAAFALRDAQFAPPNDGKDFGADVGPAVVARALRAAGQDEGRILVSVDALLVKAPGHVMLFDTGLGPKAHGQLVASLAAAGVAASQVTDVLLTHTHGDHAGGLVTADGRLAFPQAAIRMSTREWAWMKTQPGGRALVAPIAPKVLTFEPGRPVLPGVTPIAIDGHTPGHVGYEIGAGAARLLDIGDTAHSSLLSLEHPEWTMGFDTDTAVAKASRLATLARLAASHERIFAPHFPFPGVGRIVKTGGAYAWAPDLP